MTTSPASPKVVLFACVENAGRSQIAAAVFRALADPRRARAVSAGTRPAAAVHPEVRAALREAGLADDLPAPRALTPDVAAAADLLVTLGCGEECPAVPGARREDWALPDPKGRSRDEVRAIRDEIRGRVAALVAREGWDRDEPR